MVKRQKKSSKKRRNGKGFNKNGAKARKINASTAYETCTEQLSPFGGLLALIKFLDLVRFKEIFDSTYLAPRREPKLGHHLMVVGILMLLFIGFNRLLQRRTSLAFYLYPLGCDAVRFFPADQVAGGQHILALCRQLGDQSGQCIFKYYEHAARTGVAAVRNRVLSNPYQYR